MKIINYINNDYKKFKKGLDSSEDKWHFIVYYFYNSISIKIYLSLLTIIFGTIGFLGEGEGLFLSLLKSLKMFTLDFPFEKLSTNIFLFISAILSTLTVFSTVLFAFFKDIINKRISKNILNKNHTIIFGLGTINRTYLDSLIKASDVVIIESDTNNNYIEDYRARGFGFIIGDILSQEQFDVLNYNTMDKAIIALGNDRTNIELAVKIIENLKDRKVETDTRLIIHIGNPELKALFHKNFINPQNSESIKVDIKTFSFYEECSKNLFDNHLPITKNIIEKSDSYSSIVHGTGELSLSIIKDLLLLSNLPNKNQHKIYLLNRDSSSFFEKVQLITNYSKEKFPFVEFVVLDVDPNTIEFYNQKVFKENNLLNIYICNEKEENNLNIAVQLHERVFLKTLKLKARVYFAMFNEYSLSKKINTNKDIFKSFYTFGNNSEIFSAEKLNDEEGYLISKLIHNGYGDKFNRELKNININDLNHKWFKSSSYSDKLSNIAQAKHLDIKLLSLGLKKVKNENKTKSYLLKDNQKIFDSILIPLMREVGIDYSFIHKYSLELDKFWSGKPFSVMYMPKEFKNLFESLIETEHERWNSYHYINGWEYNKIKIKENKLHDCLKPLEDFVEPELQITLLYDIYSILYIPNYLAEAGFELVRIEK